MVSVLMLYNKSASLDYQALMNMVELCYQQGMQHLIMSPGSRSAPIALAFIRHGGFHWHVIPDERSAAYHALGLASATGNVVGLVCTSGTAALNYGPGIAEAFWQGLPLVAFTADRPPEWIGHGENQAIRQQSLYAPNIKGFMEVPVDLQSVDNKWYAYQQIASALNMAKGIPNGPVQVNMPFREPFYPEGPLPAPQSHIKSYQLTDFQQGLSTVNHTKLTQVLKNTDRILVIAGMAAPNEEELRVLDDFIMRTRAVLVADFLSNAHRLPSAIMGGDLISKKAIEGNHTILVPELVITIGGQLLSKSLKTFLRTTQPAEHWHINEAGEAQDTFQILSRVIPLKPHTFMREIGGKLWPKAENVFSQAWHLLDQQIKKATTGLATQKGAFSEIRAMKALLETLPRKAVLHMGNSLPVRHGQLLAHLLLERTITIKGNRGASGIDGCLSTAVGYARETDAPVYCILGDMAFMYDSNALWGHNLPANLKVIILNNSGGGVFRTLPGAKDQPELDDYFAFNYQTAFYHTACLYNCAYWAAEDWSTFFDRLNKLHQHENGPLIFELKFQDKTNFQDQSAIHSDLLRKLSINTTSEKISKTPN